MQSNNGTIKFAILFNIIFLAVFSLGTWLTGTYHIIIKFIIGYGLLWVVLLFLMGILRGLREFKFDEENKHRSYVFINIITSSILIISWSIFASFQITGINEMSILRKILMHVLGFLSTYTCYAIVTTYYEGRAYKKFGLPVCLISYPLFSIWPEIPNRITTLFITQT